MIGLIKPTVTQVAEAITHVLGIETEIVDKNLQIVAGTGRFNNKIGQYEENGVLSIDEVYGSILLTGKSLIINDATTYPNYNPTEGELAEICCPILLNDTVVGLIGLIACNGEQKEIVCSNSKYLLSFLEKMAALLASKLAETQKSSELKAVLDSIRDGIISIDYQANITSCNPHGEKLLHQSSENLLNKSIYTIWPDFPYSKIMKDGETLTDLDDVFISSSNYTTRFLITVTPIRAGAGEIGVAGAVVFFQDIFSVRTRIYNMTQAHTPMTFSQIIGQSSAILQAKKHAAQFASSDSTILITGESGTGKELFARAIHSNSSRASEPFVTINCGAIPDNLLESELFGYEAGAFTGASKAGKVGKIELANNGTLFLDEIGDFPLHLQVKILHVLQRREIERVGSNKTISVNVRFIAATNKNLEAMIKRKEFREDLYFRLNVIPLSIPPLRERENDVLLLLNSALLKFNEIIGKEIMGFSPQALDLLFNYNWPGNVRELENVVEYCVNLETEPYIQVSSLPQKIYNCRQIGTNADFTQDADYLNSLLYSRDSSLKATTNLFQKIIIESCLSKTGHSVEGKRQAAKQLHMSESTLYRKIRELGI